MTRGVLAAVLVLVTAGNVSGQDSTRSTGTPVARRTCFRGEPMPACGTFWITEASYVARLTSSGDQFTNDFGALSASLELGHLVNVSSKVAVGASVSADVVSGVALGIRSRIRYWLTPGTALDFAPGLLVAGIPGPPRFTANLSVMHQDKIGITLQSFVLPTSSYFPDGSFTTGNRFVLYGGVKLGSKYGLLGAAADVLAVAALFGIYLIACSSGCD